MPHPRHPGLTLHRAVAAMAATFTALLLAVGPVQAASPAPTPAQEPQPPQAPLLPARVLEVWARVTFAETGALHEMELADEASYPAAFAQEVRRQLSGARIRPPVVGEQPARFQTGVRLRYAVAAGESEGQVRLMNLAIRPLPLARSMPRLPADLSRSRDWTGSVKGTCTVDVEGRCAAVAVETPPGMPESLRRWARVAMSEWRFEAQRLNDQPVPGEFEHTFVVGTGSFRPEDFRIPKFDRIESLRR